MTKRIFLRWIKKFENTGTRYIINRLQVLVPGVQKVGSDTCNIDDLFEMFNTNTTSMLVHTSTVYTHL